MSAVKKLAAGFLLAVGGLSLALSSFLILPAFFLTGKDAPKADREAGIGFLIIGFPLVMFGGVSLTTGGWMVWVLSRQSQQEARDRLQATFFHLVKEGQGYITVMRFAMETQLPGEAAKAFLDEKAKEFTADFNVNAQGGISYYFNLDQNTDLESLH